MYNPYFNPYMNNRYMSQQRQQLMPTQMQNAYLMGEMVTDIETVKTARVDMSGNISYYPTLDGKTIYSKALMPDGTAKISCYELSINEPTKVAEIEDLRLTEALEDIHKRLDSISNSINEISGMWGGNSDE